MDRLEVESSMINSIGYDPYTQVLEVEFKRNIVYEYYDVPLDVYESLMSRSARGESVGVYFSAIVRNNYRYSRKH